MRAYDKIYKICKLSVVPRISDQFSLKNVSELYSIPSSTWVLRGFLVLTQQINVECMFQYVLWYWDSSVDFEGTLLRTRLICLA